MFSLNSLYLLPNRSLFRILSFIQNYFKTIALIIFVSIISYPSYRYLYESYFEKELFFIHQQLIEEIDQKHRLYQSVTQYHHNLEEKEQHISRLNQQLQNIFITHQVKLEQMQWSLEPEKSIDFSLTHQVSNIFRLIKTLSEINLLKFKEIHLIKLDQEKQLQLRANVIVIEDKNE